MFFTDAFDALDAARATDTDAVSVLTRAQRRALREEEAAAAGVDLGTYYQEEERKEQRENGRVIEKWVRWQTLRSHHTVKTPNRLRIDCEVKFCAGGGERLCENQYVKVIPMTVWRQKPRIAVGTETVSRGKDKGKKRVRKRIRKRTVKNLYTCWDHS